MSPIGAERIIKAVSGGTFPSIKNGLKDNSPENNTHR